MTIWYYVGAAALGVLFTGAGMALWCYDKGRSEYEAWALRGGRGLGNLE